MTRIASIDIGTNTILMLVADFSADGAFEIVSDEQIIIRLGKGVDSERRINEDAFQRCKAALMQYKATALDLGAERILATGTSALRDAANRDEFIARMYRDTGLEIEVISGDAEAQYTYAGAIAGMNLPSRNTAVLDIGGGSTELTLGTGNAITAKSSLDIGCVRLTERYLSTQPPAPGEMEALRGYIAPLIRTYPSFDPNITTLVSVAGTATTLAAVNLELTEYDRRAVSGHVLPRVRIRELFEEFRRLSHSDLIYRMKIDPGRADIILTGIAILHDVMEAANVAETIVSAQGLRYGIALREAKLLG